MTTGVVGTPIMLGSAESALLVPQAAGVIAGGDSSSTSLLVSFDSAKLQSESDSSNSWVMLGSVATASAFSDPLDSTSLKPQWEAVGVGATVTDSTAGLRLVPGSDGSAALLQGALAGDATVTVETSLPTGHSAVKSGLIWYLDGGDWLTVTIDQEKQIALCVETQSKDLPCTSQAGAFADSSHDVWLRVTRQATTFTASYSVDTTTWVQIGHWTAVVSNDRLPGSASTATASASTPTATIAAPTNAALQPTAPAGTPTPTVVTASVASLGFTEWGVFVTSSPGTLALPVFRDFGVTATTPNP